MKQPGERDRAKKETVRLANSTGFFVAGPGGEPPQASSPWLAGLRAWVLRLRRKESGGNSPASETDQKKEAVWLIDSAGFFVACMKKCLLVTQRHDLYCMQEVEEWKWKKPFPQGI